MLNKISKIFVRIFGSRNERLIKSYMTVSLQAGEFEEQVRQLSDDDLLARTEYFKSLITEGKQPEELLPEVFAVVREAARRNVDMRHFDVQLVGGHVLYEGKIAEMATGEGKTLVATLAVYLVHLTGRKVHLVTVNDYLAKRDAEWMKPVYESLGLTVGAIQAEMDTSGQQRKDQYNCDVTYGTNNEFGFDYLRDNMKVSLEAMAQGPLEYAIIDEVDSILVDEARTPLIISGPAFDDIDRYKKGDQVAKKLISLQNDYARTKRGIDSATRSLANARGELGEAKKSKDSERTEKAQKVIEQSQQQIDSLERTLANATEYYEVEFDKKAVHLTHDGVGAAQEIAGIGSFFTGSNMGWPHLIEQSLRAHITFEREKDYVVIEGKVVIVDEFTGRLMQGRQWSDGLHQAVEAKEAVTIKEETQTLATITLQNFFKLYEQISGMTGTAATEAEEFMSIYDLDVVTIPTNEPCIRDDMDDAIYKAIREKFNAISEEIHRISVNGRPVLVGTISIEKSEAISEALTKKFGLEHEVLNAKQHAREAIIVTKAGQQHRARDGSMHGNVTIATNMAGRGTDIKLGEGVADIGGLHILGTERHEARRIDNQLRGRTGRQGDKGSSQFFLSFDDDLMRIFSPDWTVKALSWIGWEEGQPIAHKRISKGIEKAQKKVEERNYDIRKSLLEYDEVMDYQRKNFYSRRRQILTGKGLKQIIEEMIEQAVENNCDNIFGKHFAPKCIAEWASVNFAVEIRPEDIADKDAEEIENLIKKLAKNDAANDISLSLGEYLEDYTDYQTWNISGLSKWAMSSFSVSLSPGKIKHLSAEEIEEQLVSSAAEQINKKDYSQLSDFLRDDFASRTFVNWVRSKFDIYIDIEQLAESKPSAIYELVVEKTKDKYKQREIEYPVEFAMSMVYGPQGTNVYAFEKLVEWANKKYDAGLTIEQVQNLKPRQLQKKLLELSRQFNNGQLESLIETQSSTPDTQQLANWANERFECCLSEEDFACPPDERREKLLQAGREFLRAELSDLERYVLLQVYDGTWKEHLYVMDHLKSDIWMRSYAEKDPKIEYKREGHRIFSEMLTSIEDKVTDTIFKVHLEAGTEARSVWNISQTAHDEVDQFAMAEQQRAAAQAPQTEQKVKQIKLEQPKVGRNEPCPCGSGKKYKKCCGAKT